MFHRRFGQLDKNWKDSNQSPVFIQFLDCVRQILLQFPMHFEFNEKLLLFIAQEINNSKFGTFIGDCQKERVDFTEKYPGANLGLIDLLNKLLQFNPAKRLTAQEALDHPVFKKIRNKDQEKIVSGSIKVSIDEADLDDKDLTKDTLRGYFIEAYIKFQNSIRY